MSSRPHGRTWNGLVGAEAAFCCCAGDDLVVHVEEAEPLRDEPADLLAAGARCVGDADDPAGHDNRR